MKKKFIKMFALATILGCGLGVVTSCGSNIDGTPSTEEVDNINLTLSEENLSININQTKTLTANTNNNNLIYLHGLQVIKKLLLLVRVQ